VCVCVSTRLVAKVGCAGHVAEEADLDDTGEHLDFVQELGGSVSA
jgi:hypothetical protein